MLVRKCALPVRFATHVPETSDIEVVAALAMAEIHADVSLRLLEKLRLGEVRTHEKSEVLSPSADCVLDRGPDVCA